MTPPKCSRLWMTEAARDGRLQGEERSSFERHVNSCSACSRERLALGRMRRALQRLPGPQHDSLSVRRQTQRLMAAFDAVSVAPVPRWPRAAAVIASAAALAAAASFGVHVARPRAGAAVDASAQSAIDVRGESGARWYQTTGTGWCRIVLLEGSFSLRISRAPHTRVTIGLPDGEIEDFGTVLRVSIMGARTDSIAVDEGEVVVRLDRTAEFRLAAGTSFVAPRVRAALTTEPPPAGRAKVAPLAPNAASRDGDNSPASRIDKNDRTSAQGSPRAGSSAARQSTALDDHVAEDRAFLQVVHLLEIGKGPEAQSAAGSYLLQFPNGFRRVEMLRVATGRPVR